METLFHQIGGIKTINALVDKFYKNVLEDDSINHFFKNVNMNKLKEHHNMFLMYSLAELKNMSGESLRESHKQLVKEGLNQNHFNAMISHYKHAMQDCDINPKNIHEIIKILEATRNDILGL